ncbi:cupin domain-containing protein [Vulcanococcus sp.]|uniref:cupin domain-containing protein n=1 Tax=Vulcanococcus sp. TaxID=2856995 RepID=UPI003F69EC4D
MRDSAELITQLGLQPHPEGGHFRETYKAEHQVMTPRGPRAACTAILFLLRAGERSHWHRIHSDEIWHIHGGGPLVVHELNRSGSARSSHLGMDLAHGEQPQHVVPAGSWFAAEPRPSTQAALRGMGALLRLSFKPSGADRAALRPPSALLTPAQPRG